MKRTLVRLQRLEREMAQLFRLKDDGAVVSELRALGCDVTGRNSFILIKERDTDPPELAVRREEKLRELEERGYRDMLVIVIGLYGQRDDEAGGAIVGPATDYAGADALPTLPAHIVSGDPVSPVRATAPANQRSAFTFVAPDFLDEP